MAPAPVQLFSRCPCGETAEPAAGTGLSLVCGSCQQPTSSHLAIFPVGWRGKWRRGDRPLEAVLEFGPDGIRAIPVDSPEEAVHWRSLCSIHLVESRWNSELRIQLRDGNREYSHDARLLRVLLERIEDFLAGTPFACMVIPPGHVPPRPFLYLPAARAFEGRKVSVQDLFGAELNLEWFEEDDPIRKLFKTYLSRLASSSQTCEFECAGGRDEGYSRQDKAQVSFVDHRGTVIEREVTPVSMSNFTHLASISCGLSLQNPGGAIGEMRVKEQGVVRRLSVRIWPGEWKMKVAPVQG